jgi:hypothetical protein
MQSTKLYIHTFGAARLRSSYSSNPGKTPVLERLNIHLGTPLIPTQSSGCTGIYLVTRCESIVSENVTLSVRLLGRLRAGVFIF